MVRWAASAIMRCLHELWPVRHSWLRFDDWAYPTSTSRTKWAENTGSPMLCKKQNGVGRMALRGSSNVWDPQVWFLPILYSLLLLSCTPKIKPLPWAVSPARFTWMILRQSRSSSHPGSFFPSWLISTYTVSKSRPPGSRGHAARALSSASQSIFSTHWTSAACTKSGKRPMGRFTRYPQAWVPEWSCWAIRKQSPTFLRGTQRPIVNPPSPGFFFNKWWVLSFGVVALTNGTQFGDTLIAMDGETHKRCVSGSFHMGSISHLPW